MCCMTGCVLQDLGVLTDGKFDGAEAKTVIEKAIAEKPAWTQAASYRNLISSEN